MDESHLGLRVVVVAVCLVVAVSAIGYGVYSFLNTEAGWVAIEARGGCGPDFSFQYLFSEGGMATTERHRALRNLFDELTIGAYRRFSPEDELEDVNNLHYINVHPNEDIQVDPVLYNAFEQAQSFGDRSVYLGPVYGLYTDLFYSQDDGEAANYDPAVASDQRAFCREIAGFAREPEDIDVKLLGDNTLRLEVSQAYLDYAQEQEVENFLDFGWQRNAYIIDYFAQELTAHGFTSGILTSVDGFSRSLFQEGSQSVYHLYTWHEEGRPVVACQAELPNVGSVADFRAFPASGEAGRYYVWEDGTVRHPYIDLADGLCRSAVPTLALYASDKTCVQLMQEGRGLFIAEELDRTGLAALAEEGIGSLAVEGQTVLHSDPGLELQELYDGYQTAGLGE